MEGGVGVDHQAVLGVLVRDDAHLYEPADHERAARVSPEITFIY